jgi:hypothetical protein
MCNLLALASQTVRAAASHKFDSTGSQNALILLAVRKCTACTIVLAHRDLYCRTLYAAAARFRVLIGCSKQSITNTACTMSEAQRLRQQTYVEVQCKSSRC